MTAADARGPLAASASSFVPVLAGAPTPAPLLEAREARHSSGHFRVREARQLLSANSREVTRDQELAHVKAVWVAVGALAGVVVAIVLAQLGVGDSAPAIWFAVLPGQLFSNALLVITLPLVFLHAVSAGVHYSGLRKTKQVAGAATAAFVATTLYSSALGAIVAMAVAEFFKANTALETYVREHEDIGTASAHVAFQCPADNTTDAARQLTLQDDGTLFCEESNSTGTQFVLDDFSHTFRLTNHTDMISMTEQTARALESFFPKSVGTSLLSTDVLGLVIAGLVLGAALNHCSKKINNRENANPKDSSLLFLLVSQAEIVFTAIFWWVQRLLPIGAGFMICSGMLRTSNESAVTPSSEAVLALFGGLIVGLLINLISILSLATLLSRARPIRYAREMLPAVLLAFCSSSSLAALPSTLQSIETTRQVSMPLAQIVCAAGTAINKSGTAVYLSIASVYLLTSCSEANFTAGSVVLMILANAVGAVIAPPMPGGNCAILSTTMVVVFNINSSESGVLIAFLAAMDWVCDPIVAAVNTLNTMLVTFVLAGRLNEKYLDQSCITEDGTERGSVHGMQHRTIHHLEADDRMMSLSLGDSHVAL